MKAYPKIIWVGFFTNLLNDFESFLFRVQWLNRKLSLYLMLHKVTPKVLNMNNPSATRGDKPYQQP